MPRVSNTNTEPFERCWRAYGRKGSKKVARAQWDRMDDEEREMAERHIPFYVGNRERVYCKDFERYLRDRAFESPVYSQKGELVFDPDEEVEVQNVLEGFQG